MSDAGSVIFFGMKNKIRITILALAVIGTGFSASGQEDQENRRTISVNGKAEHSLPADRVVISAEIRVERDKLSDAREQSETSFKRLVKKLGELGIKPAEIELSNHSLGKNYETINDERKHVGFYSERDFLVNLDDVSLLEAVHQELAEDSEIETNRTNFYRKDEIEVREKARVQALEAAKKKATDMSGVYGQKIGEVLEISEVNVGYSSPSNYFPGNQIDVLAGNTTTGRVSISAQVKVIFELVD